MVERISDAIASIYATVDGLTPWHDVLRGLCRTVGARGAMLALERPGEPVTDSHQFGFDPEWLIDYARDWAPRSPYLDRLYDGDGPVDSFVASQDLLPYEQWLRSEMFNESARHQDVHHGAAACFDTTDGMKVRLSFVRDERMGAFSREEITHLDGLLPHLRQALRLNHAFPDPLAERIAQLDGQHTAALVLDDSLAIRTRNRSAAALLERCALLNERNGALHLGDDARTRQLAAAVSEVCGDLCGRRHFCIPEASPPGATAAPLLSFLLTPAPSRLCLDRRESDRGTGLALLTAVQRDRPRQLSEALLRSLYDLTPAEARVARWIASGLSPEQTAIALEVQISTVRWHLKRVFAKTGVSGQTELAALLQALAHASS